MEQQHAKDPGCVSCHDGWTRWIWAENFDAVGPADKDGKYPIDPGVRLTDQVPGQAQLKDGCSAKGLSPNRSRKD